MFNRTYTTNDNTLSGVNNTAVGNHSSTWEATEHGYPDGRPVLKPPVDWNPRTGRYGFADPNGDPLPPGHFIKIVNIVDSFGICLDVWRFRGPDGQALPGAGGKRPY